MSDEDLRQLERDGAHSDEDQARLLAARVRAGTLDPGRLELAALFGIEAAAQAVEALGLPPGEGDLRDRVIAAALRTRDPKETLVRVTLAVGKHMMAWSKAQSYIRRVHRQEMKAAAAAMVIAHEWLRSPTSAAAEAAISSSAAVSELAPFFDPARVAGQIIASTAPTGGRESASRVAVVALAPLNWGDPGPIAAVVREEMGPWLLSEPG
ncbi:MAG: hypothetical protein AB7N76_10625 [Planctomycetota bacterium]